MVKFKEKAKLMYDNSYFTLTGCDLKADPLESWVDHINGLLRAERIPEVPIEKWEVFKGKDMNDLMGLTNQNRYKQRLTFLAFELPKGMNEMQIGNLAMLKLKVGARWFNDIVANDLMREGRKVDDLF